MGTHRKFFPVGKMPWHTDDHKFGESTKVTWGDVAEKLVPFIEVLEKEWKEWKEIGTIAMVEDGLCHVCGGFAVYLFMGKLYCPTCWLAWDEDSYG